MVTEPFTPEPSMAVAVMVAVPMPTAVTWPSSSTVTTCSLSDDHSTQGIVTLTGSTLAFTVVVSPTISSVLSAVTSMLLTPTTSP